MFRPPQDGDGYSGSCCSLGCLKEVFYVIIFCFLISECTDRCGCTNDTETKPAAYDSLPTDVDTAFLIYLDSFIRAHDTLVIDSPIVESPKTQPQTKTYTPHVTHRHSAAYEAGYHKGYAQGEEDAIAGGEWESGFDADNNYEDEDYDEYKKGYYAGYEAGYNDNYESQEEREGY